MDKKTKRILLVTALVMLGLFWGPMGIFLGILLLLVLG